MRILVTGGNGFLGGEIIRQLLAEGHHPVSLQRSEAAELRAAGVETRQGSIVSPEACEEAVSGCEAVIHVAAKAGVWGPREAYFGVNLEGTRQLLAAARAAGVARFVYTSTPSVVFTGESFGGEDESLPYGRNWLCHYAESKALAEAEVLKAHHQGRFQTCALRPHLIWGAGDPHLVPRIVERGRNGRLKQVGDGRNRVDMTHVGHAARAHLLALTALSEGRAGGQAYFLSDGQPVFLWSWVGQLFEDLNLPPIRGSVSLKQAYLAGAVCEKVWSGLRLQGEPPMTRFVATELAKDHWFSIEKARTELGYFPESSLDSAYWKMLEDFLP